MAPERNRSGRTWPEAPVEVRDVGPALPPPDRRTAAPVSKGVAMGARRRPASTARAHQPAGCPAQCERLVEGDRELRGRLLEAEDVLGTTGSLDADVGHGAGREHTEPLELARLHLRRHGDLLLG